MITINLDPEFSPGGAWNAYQSFDFPSGCEPHIKISPIYTGAKECRITCRIRSGNDIIRLLLATDALRRMGIKDISVFIPYVPFARQDRVMVPGEPLSIKVFADLINSQGYDEVTVYDPHSEVSAALINNCRIIDNHVFIAAVLKHNPKYTIVCPDAGAYKKIFKLCEHLGYTGDIILCNKIRNVSTGQIREVTVSASNLSGKHLLIVDDICDAGGTFNLLAEKLNKLGAETVDIAVSHGIFSKGEDIFKSYIGHIYTTDSFKDISSDFITQIQLRTIL